LALDVFWDMRILTRTPANEDEGYDAAVPNKTIYVSEGDLPLYQRAQELAGGNLSAAISKALRRWVDSEESISEGYKDVVVRVGLDKGRKVRFTAALVGEYVDPSTKRADHYRVYRGRTGKYVVHVERQAEYWTVNSEGKPAGWRGWVGVGDVKYGATPQESTLEVVGSLEELRTRIPQQLYDMVAGFSQRPPVEDLDI
jgi:EXLDI family protein